LLRPNRVKINAAYYQKHKETIKIRNAAKAAAKKQAKLAHYERLRSGSGEAERERRRASRKKYKREEKERERAREAKKQKRFEELRENYPKR